MENKFLGYENEEELIELAETDVNESGGATPAITPATPGIVSAITAITNLATNVICPSGACTSHC